MIVSAGLSCESALRRVVCVVSFVVLVGCAASLVAQSLSVQIGVTRPRGYTELEMGVRGSVPIASVFSIDASFDVYPRYFTGATLGGVMDLSASALLRPLAPVAVVARVGGAGLVSAGSEGAILFRGYQAGAGAIVTADARTTVRLDYTVRRMRMKGDYPVLPSFTFGFVVRR